jgi:uroporphyrinogen decarboxylase
MTSRERVFGRHRIEIDVADVIRGGDDLGNDLCFWGGVCDTQAVLPRGRPRAVNDRVKQRREILVPGGGFVFNTVHNRLPEVPPQNPVALFEASEEFNA